MGCDAAAAIIYGFPFEGEDFDPVPEYQEDSGKWLAKFQGLPEPEGSFLTNDAEWSKYWSDRRTLPINTTCDGDTCRGETTDYLCVRESMLAGSWGGATEIPVGHIKEPPPEWDALLREFCEKAGIPFGKPKWYLIASYG